MPRPEVVQLAPFGRLHHSSTVNPRPSLNKINYLVEPWSITAPRATGNFIYVLKGSKAICERLMVMSCQWGFEHAR